MPEHRFLILLVNYNNEQETCSFVEDQLLRQKTGGVGVAITDNGSREISRLKDLEKKYPDIFLFAAGENLGYLPGAAFGLRKYRELTGSLPEIIILCNADIGIPDESFLTKLTTVTGPGGYDVMGPDIESGFLKQHQNPYIPERISISKLKGLSWLTSCFIVYNAFLVWYFLKTRIRAIFQKPSEYAGEQRTVYGIHGSFMIFRKSFFEKGGTLDYPIRLFGEEVFIAEQALRLGLKVVFDPSFRVIHRQHSTTGIFKSRQMTRMLHESFVFLLNQRKPD
jgi:GT2 family glycosyltransferase